MKVREIITAAGWINGSGFSYESDIENHIVEIDTLPTEMDWSWIEADDTADDIPFTVRYYAEDDDDLTTPIAEHKAWASEVAA